MVTSTTLFTSSDGREFTDEQEAETWERRVEFACKHIESNHQYQNDARRNAAAIRAAKLLEAWDEREHVKPALSGLQVAS